MDLKTYLDKRGRGAVTALFRRTGVTTPTIYEICRTGKAKTLETAEKISAGTDGEVSVAELLGLAGVVANDG